MQRVKRICVPLLIGAIFIFGTACNQSQAAGADSGRSAAELRQQLAQFDFSPDLAKCGFSIYDDPETQTTGYDRSLAQRVRRFIHDGQVPDRVLTRAEKQRLGVLKGPGKDGGTGLFLLIGTIRKHFNETGAFPASAVDLYPELLTAQGYNAFAALPTAERMEKYGAGVNPITGYFYGSFEDTSWTPGGIKIEHIDDPVKAQERFPTMRMPLDMSNPNGETRPINGVWLLHIYGEEPDSSLLDETYWW
jgi:hypothetical protein